MLSWHRSWHWWDFFLSLWMAIWETEEQNISPWDNLFSKPKYAQLAENERRETEIDWMWLYELYYCCCLFFKCCQHWHYKITHLNSPLAHDPSNLFICFFLLKLALACVAVLYDMLMLWLLLAPVPTLLKDVLQTMSPRFHL